MKIAPGIAVAALCTLSASMSACGPKGAGLTASGADSTTSGMSTGDLPGGTMTDDGSSGSTTGGVTSGTTTAPDGPYVYDDEVVALDAPPPRARFTLEALPGGRALIVGGLVPDGPDADGELDVVDSTLRWQRDAGFVAGPQLLQPRFEHDSAALADGSILLFSGRSSHDFMDKLVDVERIDADATLSESIGALTEARRDVTAVAEPGDTVVVLGDSFVTAERFDPATGMSTPLDIDLELPIVSAFMAPLFSAARRGNGEIVTLGGVSGTFDQTWFTRGPEVLDLESKISRLVSDDAAEPTRFRRQALTLPDGSVLLLGNPGFPGIPGPWLMRLDANDTLITLQEFADPDTRFTHTPVGVVLADGRVWIVGTPGFEPGTATQFYDPVTDGLSTGPSLPTPTVPLAAVLLDAGPVLLIGGSVQPWEDPTLSAYLLE